MSSQGTASAAAQQAAARTRGLHVPEEVSTYILIALAAYATCPAVRLPMHFAVCATTDAYAAWPVPTDQRTSQRAAPDRDAVGSELRFHHLQRHSPRVFLSHS